MHAGGSRVSLRWQLALLVALCVLPLLGFGALLVQRYSAQLLTQVEGETLLLAKKVMAEVDREWASVEGGLAVLATSDDLIQGRWEAFRRQAHSAIAAGMSRNYVVTDAQGRQLFNTLVPAGQALPEGGTPPELLTVLQGRPALTGWFLGPVTGQPTVAMGVPVRAAGEVRYALNVGLPAARLSDFLTRQPLPDGWLIALIDRSGRIVTRSREGQRYAGQPVTTDLAAALAQGAEGKVLATTKEGIPVYTAFTTSERWGWRVAVGAPVHLLQAEQQRVLRGLVLAGGLALVAGILMAAWLAQRVLTTVRALNQAAANLHRGGALELPPLQLKEAEEVGRALERAAQSMEQVQYLANHDPLTGLANRGLFFEVGRQRLELARRQQRPLALLALDLDGFKPVNDHHGHAVGDALLKEVADRLLETSRSADVVARLGGDEFVLLLSDTDADQARQTGERLLAALAPPWSAAPQPVTVSIGLALYPADGERLEDLLLQADRALYAAKAAGKQRLSARP
ncbi:GGDEF domain-containing protein [Inhella gelatinilytica]|uniref:Diguanylate cyclase n=1 Tax=Inhella gelatinilytica TaxID=2795030 RepID=A0A931IV57_9BURK|nr:sensor domain-containing diguanylate cyclase [Inhella gelatinilytica]MBH9552131.1 diguanylate cyclase [Inhella gelatinilytica]